MTDEIWKKAKCNEMYLVSNLGIVKSLSRGRNLILSQTVCSNGYKAVSFYRNKKEKRTVFIHHLVASLFVVNKDPSSFNVVNHIDGVKTNNHAVNLEWCTQKMNDTHALRTGLKPSMKGVLNKEAKLSEEDVFRIRDLISKGVLMQTEIARMFNIAKTTVTDIKKGRTWGHLKSSTNRGPDS